MKSIKRFINIYGDNMLMSKRVNADKLVAILDKLFVVPDDRMERLTIAGLTERQATALIRFGEGDSILKVTKAITNGSEFTQNGYDALGVAISKIFEAILLVKEISEHKELVSEILKRGLNYKRRFALEYK